MHSDLINQAHTIIRAATTEDAVPPISEQFLLNLEHNTFFKVLEDDGTLQGFATFDGSSAELVVAPAARRQGVGARLMQQLDAHGVGQVWAHGDLPAAQALMRGRPVLRELLKMQITQPELQRASGESAVALPPGFEVVHLDALQAGQGDVTSYLEQWVEVNNQAFSWHPEQGGWDLARLEQGMSADWFAAHDVLLLLDDDKQVAGFHWTKQVDGEPGEVYVVGLGDAYRGKGLGGPLVAQGLAHLRAAGNDTVVLYVEGDNAPAVSAYERLGFGVVERHVVYGRLDQ